MTTETKIVKIEENLKMLADQVKNLDQKVDEKFNNLDCKIDSGFSDIKEELKKYVLKEVYELQMKGLNKSISKNTNNWDWVIKAVMSLVIGALIGVILKTRVI